VKEKIGLLLLRISLGVVFLIFGVGKFRGDIWVRTIESMDLFKRLPFSVDIAVFATGVLEVATGCGLILGLFRRWFSVLAALQLTAILFLLQFQEVRDLGLLGAAVYMALIKRDSWGIDYFFRRKFNQ